MGKNTARNRGRKMFKGTKRGELYEEQQKRRTGLVINPASKEANAKYKELTEKVGKGKKLTKEEIKFAEEYLKKTALVVAEGIATKHEIKPSERKSFWKNKFKKLENEPKKEESIWRKIFNQTKKE